MYRHLFLLMLPSVMRATSSRPEEGECNRSSLVSVVNIRDDFLLPHDWRTPDG